MRRLGLIGGMSWESSAEYYRFVNEEVRERLGGLHSAECVMFSFDFHDIERLQREDRWDEAGERLAAAGRDVQAAGAELLVLCTNTMHRLFGELEATMAVPLLHIADPTADAVRAQGVRKVGLLATRYTMEGDFYRGRLEDMHGLTVLVPEEPDRTAVHDIIYEELVVGEVRPESAERYRDTIEGLVRRGADGIVLGCTEIELLVCEGDSPVPLFDTARLHARAAVDWSLGTIAV